MFSFLYNRTYKKIIIVIFTFFLSLPYWNKIPYPLLLDIPKSNEIKIADEWKNLKYPCFKVETLSGNWLSDYSDYFSIYDYENFRLNPGLYFGKEIKDYTEKSNQLTHALIKRLKKINQLKKHFIYWEK